ncbi:VOC family protein [Thalassotalea agariperforans]
MMIEERNLRSICHASVGTNQLREAKVFYQKLLATLDIVQVCDYEHAAAFGKGGYPEFWVQIPFDGQAMSVGNGTHFGFVATSKRQVDDFYQMAISQGAKCNGKPGPRPEYGEPYYGCFVLDLDGNRIEASYWHQD